jgi:hypothetical protein
VVCVCEECVGGSCEVRLVSTGMSHGFLACCIFDAGEPVARSSANVIEKVCREESSISLSYHIHEHWHSFIQKSRDMSR